MEHLSTSSPLREGEVPSTRENHKRGPSKLHRNRRARIGTGAHPAAAGVSTPTPSHHPSAKKPPALPVCTLGTAESPKVTSPEGNPSSGADWCERSCGGAPGKRLGRWGKSTARTTGKTASLRRKSKPSLLSLFQNLTLEGAHIVAGDIASTNGIIHVIDKVDDPIGRSCSSAPQTSENN